MRPKRSAPWPTLTIGVVVAAVAIAVRVWAFGGVTFGIGYDDGRYVTVAQNLANGFLPDGPGEWFGTRVVFLWPIAATFRLFGASDYAAVAWPLVGSLVGVAAAGLIGRELGGARVGLVSAALTASAPLEVLFATRVRPDSWMPALFAIAVWCALKARRSGGGVMAWSVAAGVALGMSWSVRESAPVLAPVLAVALWRCGRRALAAAAVGALAVPLLVGVAFALVGGRFSQPLTSTAGTAVWRNPITAWGANPSYSWLLWRDAFDPDALFFLVLPLLVVVAAILVARRQGAALIPAIWLAWAAFYLEFGTLVNVAKPTRYLTLCSIPFAVLVALALDGRLAFLAPVGVLAVAVAALSPLPGREQRATDVVLLNRVADRLEGLPPGPVLSASYTWWAKLRVYRATERVPVRRVVEPTYLGRDERLEARMLRPLPTVASFRGGYVVGGPVIRRASWPRNWPLFQARMRERVPMAALVAVARVGRATIYRWPSDVGARPSARPSADR